MERAEITKRLLTKLEELRLDIDEAALTHATDFLVAAIERIAHLDFTNEDLRQVKKTLALERRLLLQDNLESDRTPAQYVERRIALLLDLQRFAKEVQDQLKAGRVTGSSPLWPEKIDLFLKLLDETVKGVELVKEIKLQHRSSN